MRKMIMMVLATFIWRKIQTRMARGPAVPGRTLRRR